METEKSGKDIAKVDRVGEGVCQYDLRLLSATESADFSALSTEVQAIAHRFNAEFEAVLAVGETDEVAEGAADTGAAIVQRLLPTVVAVLEQLDDFYKDHAAYRAEVLQLREENASLLTQLTKAKSSCLEIEDLLMRMEEQFDNERKTLTDAITQYEAQIRRLEVQSRNTDDQLARLEQRDLESSKENSRLHERINELLRSHVELNDTTKSSVALPVSALMSTRDSSTTRMIGNAFDATSAGVGFDELSALEDDAIPSGDDELPDELSLALGHYSDSEIAVDCAGIQREVNQLIRENMELVETKNALNIVKDDLLLQRDNLKAENQLLTDGMKQLTEKQSMLQQELVKSDQTLTNARTEMETLKATLEQCRKEHPCEMSSNKNFTKAEVMRLISDRNHYKELFLDLCDAVKLAEVIRASQHGHPELLDELPSAVTDVQLRRSTATHHQLKNVFDKIMNPKSHSRFDFSSEAMPHADSIDKNPKQEVSTHTDQTASSTVSTSPYSHRWIRIRQFAAAAPVFGWVRTFGRLRQGKAEAKNPTSLFFSINHPVPKKCRSIGRPTQRLELTAALSLPSPLGKKSAQHLWLIGRGADSDEVAGRKRPKYVGKLFVYDPLELNLPLVSLNFEDEFLPISLGLFSVSLDGDAPPPCDNGRPLILRDFTSLQDSKTPIEPQNTYRVLIAASDGRFIVCAITRNPDAISQESAFKVALLSTFRLANAGESATAIVSLGHRICLGVLNSTGSSQLVTLKWPLKSTTLPSNDDIELNRILRTSAMSLPSDSAPPSGPILISLVFGRTFCCLGTAGGGILHRFDISTDGFVARLNLPSQTPCLHAIAVGSDDSSSSSSTPSGAVSPGLIWLAVSGLSPPTPTTLQRRNEAGGDVVYTGPLSRLLSVCAEKHVFVHNIDLTSVLTSMIDMTGVQDPVDLTVSRLFVQGNESIWFATRCGLIGRFFKAYLPDDGIAESPIEVHNQEVIALSCHAYRRPVSALIEIHNQEDSEEKDVTAYNQTSYLVVAIGHDYAYLQTSTSAPPIRTTSLVSEVNNRIQSSPGAHAIVWGISA